MPGELTTTVAWLDQGLAAGAVHSALARALDAVTAATSVDRPTLLAWILSAVEGHSTLLQNPARSGFSDRLRGITLVDHEEQEYRAQIFARLSPTTAPNTPGRVTVLFATNTVPQHGVARELSIQVAAYGGGIRLLHRDDDAASLYVGFWSGAAAALDLVVSRLASSEPALMERLIYNRQVTGTMAASVHRASGESLGLGTAIGTLSALAGLTVSSTDAFTGRVDRSGRLHAVDGLPGKCQAALDAGCTRVFVPADYARPSLPPGIELLACDTLEDAVRHAFDAEALRAALEQIALERPARMPARDWRTVPDARPRVLFTMVGTSDPIGTYKDRAGRSLPQSEDGPILTACREIRPSRLVLFYTTAGDNDFTENAERVHAFVSAQIPECGVTLRPLPSVEDPTDLEVLWEAMRSELGELQTGEDADLFGRYNAFVSMSSGTGQMQFVWAELTRTHVLPATLLQVRESRRLKEGESRIRRVVLPSAQ